MKKQSPKLKSARKTEQDRPCQKFWLLVKGQRKKVKVKVNGPGSKSTNTGPSRFRVSRSGHGSSSRSADVILWRGLGLTWTCLRGCWRGVMTSSGDVRWHQQQSSVRVRRVLSPPAREEDARNPRGAWERVYGRMRAGISGSIDRWLRRPSWRRVCAIMIWKSSIWGGAWEILRS